MKVRHASLLVLSAAIFASGCAKSKSADEQFLESVNNAISSFVGDIRTCYDAVQVAAKAGYDLEGYALNNNDYCFAFDIDAKRFVVMNDDELVYAPKDYKRNVNSYSYFKFTNAYDASSIYSQYLTSDFAGADLLVVTTGLDMGSNWNVKTITYNNTSGISKEIVLNTFSDYLNINADLDCIHHYGDANNVFISSIGEHFHASGVYAYVQAMEGDIYFEDGCEIDLFERPEKSTAVTYTSSGAAIYAALNAPNVPTTIGLKTKIIDTNDYTELTDDTNHNFYRLNSDVSFPVDNHDESAWEINREIFLDLNGHKLSFTGNKDNVTEEGNYHKGIMITPIDTDFECYIIDTQSTLYERSGVYLNDCSIIVAGDEEHSARLNIDSGKIHDVRGVVDDFGSSYNNPAVLCMGNTSTNKDRKAHNSSVYMYGGYITSVKGPKYYDDSVAFKCLQPRGKGAYIEMNYGDLYSYHYCISGQGTYSDSASSLIDQFGDTEIKITGGTLVGGVDPDGVTGTHSYTPLFFPQKGKLIIDGGNVTGPTCMDVKAGEITINGGIFTATGDFIEDAKPLSGGGSMADGSVLLVESNGHYRGGDVKMSITDATMKSSKGYITNVIGRSDYGFYNVDVTHSSGIYYYAQSSGTHINDVVKEDGHATITVNGGEWIPSNR